MKLAGPLRSTLVALAWLAFTPGAAFAQSALAGVVKDTTGAILPGVTVEASSPVLIERSRVVTTDEAGLYRIVDLRPGTYLVTFTLVGFNTFKREGVELPANFTSTINAELRVGSLLVLGPCPRGSSLLELAPPRSRLARTLRWTPGGVS